MGSAFTPADTYTRVIGEADDAHGYVAGVDRFEIELRPLDAGDRAKVRDALAMERTDGAAGMALGTVELLHVEAAIVGWSLPEAPGSATVRRLRPAVLEAIREHVSYGEIPATPPTHAEQITAENATREAAEAAERRADLERDELREGDLEPQAVVRLPLES